MAAADARLSRSDILRMLEEYAEHTDDIQFNGTLDAIHTHNVVLRNALTRAMPSDMTALLFASPMKEMHICDGLSGVAHAGHYLFDRGHHTRNYCVFDDVGVADIIYYLRRAETCTCIVELARVAHITDKYVNIVLQCILGPTGDRAGAFVSDVKRTAADVSRLSLLSGIVGFRSRLGGRLRTLTGATWTKGGHDDLIMSKAAESVATQVGAMCYVLTDRINRFRQLAHLRRPRECARCAEIEKRAGVINRTRPSDERDKDPLGDDPFAQDVCVTCGDLTDLRCAGCDTLSVCSIACAKKAWKTHRGVCPRKHVVVAKDKTPAPLAPCMACGVHTRLRCTGCGTAAFCSYGCYHCYHLFGAAHRRECATAPAAAAAAATMAPPAGTPVATLAPTAEGGIGIYAPGPDGPKRVGEVACPPSTEDPAAYVAAIRKTVDLVTSHLEATESIGHVSATADTDTDTASGAE